jgi:hypothetical protein
VFELLEEAAWQYSIGVRMIKSVRPAVEAIDQDAWQRIDYPEEGEAQARRPGGSACPSRAARTLSCRLLGILGRLTRAAPAIPPRSLGRSLRHQDLREGSALEAFLFDDLQLQVLSQRGKWAVPRADRNGDRRQLVFVDEAQAGQRHGEVTRVVAEPLEHPSIAHVGRDLPPRVNSSPIGGFGLRRRHGRGEGLVLGHDEGHQPEAGDVQPADRGEQCCGRS